MKKTFEMVVKGNCSFDLKTLCNWRNERIGDHFDWLLRQGATPSLNTGPSSDHSGGGRYIHIEASYPAKQNQFAELLSPFIWGPKCLHFFYHMYGLHIGRLDVLVRATGQRQNYLTWQRTGNQGNQWRKAVVFIPFVGEFQVALQGVAGQSYQGDIAVDDVILTDGMCVDQSETSVYIKSWNKESLKIPNSKTTS
ncbi:MAM and LDL-receptor class A domain-containing protein 1-like [Stylophora pistillata]|uniref:MAM and LDL-receptor class A domain-containing protein 1-like n=1 Tax=Stylophora pistillata TaxID=50429 RepID=UPI000C045CA8|nr:MAM and LDL-receptor class A domain-containing protein 1-like [Stylophora pistillata]